jgi:hypothetical protein
MGSVLCVILLCCSLPGEELKTICIVVASRSNTTTDITDEQAKAVGQALAAAAPSFRSDNGTLTAFAYLPHRKSGQEIFRATHVSDCPVNSVFAIESVVSRFILNRIIRKVAPAWSRVRHPELPSSLVPEVKIEGTRVEVLFRTEPAAETEVIEPEAAAPGK